METIKRPPRPGRAKLATGSIPTNEPLQATEAKKRVGKPREALADVTNTISLKSQSRPVRACVAKRGVTVRELEYESALKPSKGLQLQSTSKKDKGKPATEVVSSPSVVEESESKSVARKRSDIQVKSARGRRTKEQLQLESKFGSEEVGHGSVSGSQGMTTGITKTTRLKPRGKAIRSTDTEFLKSNNTDILISKGKLECNQRKIDAGRQQHSVSKSSEESGGKSVVAYSRLKSRKDESNMNAVTKRKREPVRAKDIGSEGSNGLMEAKGASSSSFSGVDDKSMHDGTLSQKTDVVLSKEGKYIPEKISVARKGLAIKPCLHEGAASDRQGKDISLKSIQHDVEGRIIKPAEGKAVKDEHSQTPYTERCVRKERRFKSGTEQLQANAKGKKETGSGKVSEKGTTTTESGSTVSKLANLTGAKRDAGLRKKIAQGNAEELPKHTLTGGHVQQTCRRNASRGARKAVYYAEDGDLGTPKVFSIRKEAPVKLDGQMSKQICGTAQVVNRIVRQTANKGRKKGAGTEGKTKICGQENTFTDRREDLQQTVNTTMSLLKNSLEQEYEQFKKERRMNKDTPEKPLPKPLTKSKPLVKTPVIEAGPIVSTVDCTSMLATVTTKPTNNKLESKLKALANKPTQPKLLGRKMNIKSSSRSQKCVQEVEQCDDHQGTSKVNSSSVEHSEKVRPILTQNLVTRMQIHRTPVQRGQKRGRKDITAKTMTLLVQPPEPENTSTISKADMEPNHVSSLKVDVTPVVLFEDPDKDNQVINEVPDRAEVEAQEQMCVDVSGPESGDSYLKALASFDDADIPAKVKECCKALGKPLPLQAHALPFLLAGRDLVAVSDSAGGRIHAYGVPALVHALKKKKSYVRKRPSPMCLILTPSSELVREIQDTMEETFKSLRVKIGSASGDPEDLNTVKPGVAVVVTTPDCLQKMLEDGSCSLALVSYVVLDGADCMFQSGFEACLQDIFNQAPTCRQLVVFSSSWEPEVEQLVKDLNSGSELVKVVVNNPVDTHEQLGEEEDVTQIVEVLEESDRDRRLTTLLQIFQKGKKNRVLVYVLYKEEALHVEGLLQQRGWKVAAVHGGIFEADRSKAVVSFQKGSSSVLVATDVAARGLAIPNVDHVINYSFPYTSYDYSRRLCQVGRPGRKGIMHTFFMPTNQARAKELVELLREAAQDVPEELLKLTSPANKKPRIDY